MRSITIMLLVASILAMGGATQCDPEACTPDNPNYDPATETCPTTQPDVGDPGPGTGGLPTEPGTETPDEAGNDVDEDSVNLDVYGLNGLWLDSGRKTCIIHNGSGVTARYLEFFECYHGDGTGITTATQVNLTGTIAGDQITGKTSFCVFGFGEDSGVENGIHEPDFVLTIGEDGKSLTGTWHDYVMDEDVEFSLTRETVGNCQG